MCYHCILNHFGGIAWMWYVCSCSICIFTIQIWYMNLFPWCIRCWCLRLRCWWVVEDEENLQHRFIGYTVTSAFPQENIPNFGIIDIIRSIWTTVLVHSEWCRLKANYSVLASDIANVSSRSTIRSRLMEAPSSSFTVNIYILHVQSYNISMTVRNDKLCFGFPWRYVNYTVHVSTCLPMMKILVYQWCSS